MSQKLRKLPDVPPSSQHFTAEDMGIYETVKKKSILKSSKVTLTFNVFVISLIAIFLVLIFSYVKKAELQQNTILTKMRQMDQKITTFTHEPGTIFSKMLFIDQKITALTDTQDTILTKMRQMDQKITTFTHEQGTISSKMHLIDQKITALNDTQDAVFAKLRQVNQTIVAKLETQGTPSYLKKFNGLQTLNSPQLKDWIIFQYRNFKSGDSFKNGNWQNYKDGFGNLECDAFWLGLDKLRLLTSTGKWKLLIAVKYDKHGNGSADIRRGTWGWGIWEEFSIGEDRYQLRVGKRVKMFNMGNRDPRFFHNEKYFSTKDNDNDFADFSCALAYGGGWWFSDCYSACLNCDIRNGNNSVWLDTYGATFEQGCVLAESLMAIYMI